METALTDPRKTEVNEDFRVSTALFAARLETRLFSKIDEVPAELVKLITEAVNACTMLDRKFLGTDTGYRSDETEYDDYDDYEYDPTPYVCGIYVDTYGFADSEDIHEAMVSAVRKFVTSRKRTVSYV